MKTKTITVMWASRMKPVRLHVYYLCSRCGSRMIEEFTLADVFIDNPPAS
jgi:hypothetical protein